MKINTDGYEKKKIIIELKNKKMFTPYCRKSENKYFVYERIKKNILICHPHPFTNGSASTLLFFGFLYT